MKSSLWYIDRRAYDLRPWMARHPGGAEVLRHAEGSDCTELFHTYHLMRLPSPAMLAPFEVQVDPNDPVHAAGMRGSHFTFAEGDFYRTVQARVRAYFKENKLQTGATRPEQALALVMLLGAIGLVIPAFVFGSVPAAMLLAVVKTLTALGPGHSMSHFSLFPRGRWNMLVFRLTSPFLLSNPAIWGASHVRSHHVHTLTPVDLQDNYPIKRIQPALTWRPWHRGQHLYSWLVYLFGVPLWSLSDFVKSAGSLLDENYGKVRYPLNQRIENTLVIGCSLFISVFLPFVCLDWKQALLVWLIVTVPSSFFLVIQIMVNHEVPETMNKVELGKPIDWGVHQVLTSHNFAVDSAFALHCSGGLNLQVEHHLFPGVHYSHYPAISKIVREVCAEFGLPYNTSPSLWHAIAKHYRVLQLNSAPPSEASAHA